MWSPSRRARAAHLSRYWNALVGGDAPETVEQLSSGVDPDLMSDIALVRRGHRPAHPYPNFVDNLEEDLMNLVAQTQPASAPPSTLSLNGHAAAYPGRSSRPAKPAHRPLRFPLASWAALMLLVVALTAGAVLLTGRFPVNSPRPSGTGNSIPAVIPASPEPAATPGPIVDGIAQFLWATDAGGPGFVSRPGFTNFDPAGQIWVSNAETGQYVIYDADGAFIETWGEAGTGPGQFNFFSPAGADLGDVAFAADGSFFVADTGNHRVQKFAADRTFLLSWGDSGDGTADGELRGPGSIVILSDGTLLVADYDRNDIQQFAADGTFLGSFAKEDATNTALRGPAGMTVAPDGTVWIATVVGVSVLKYSPTGELLLTIAGPGEASFSEPWDVAFDAAGNVSVADFYAGKIEIFALDGTYLTQWGAFGTEPGQFKQAGSIAIDDNNIAYVSEFGRVQAFQLLPLPTSQATPTT